MRTPRMARMMLAVRLSGAAAVSTPRVSAVAVMSPRSNTPKGEEEEEGEEERCQAPRERRWEKVRAKPT